MKIVFLDAATVGKDVSLDGLKQFGETVLYDATGQSEAALRMSDCDIVITNKVHVFKEEIDAARNLKLICVAATGVNCVDVEYAASKGIPVKNVPAYSTESVAQVCLMHILNLVGHGMYFNEVCHDGRYSRSGMFSDVLNPFWELKGKKMGVIGMGNIGSRVAELAAAFGMSVAYFSTSGTGHCKDYPCVTMEELLRESDVLSVNCPLNPRTKDLITYEDLKRMKPGAYIVNCSRGGIINENDLVRALNDGLIAGAAVDTFETEPLPEDHPYLTRVKEPSRLILSPHIGWTSIEARIRLVEILEDNIRTFLKQ